MIIAIEGLDASGKATQTKQLVKRINAFFGETSARRFEFPNYPSITGQAIKGHLQGKWFGALIAEQDKLVDKNQEKFLNELVFQCLMTVDRYAMASELIPFELSNKHHAVLDRYSVSGRVYGAVGGLDRVWLHTIHEHLPEPVVWIYIDISLDESIKRRPERRDRIESNLPFLSRIREEYMRLFQLHSQDFPKKWVVIDGIGTTEEVHERIWKAVHWSI